MSQVILHHYQLSPYSEKIRLALGLKALNWRSVEIPVWTPRPKLTPMTGGYRRTPILQVGAEFYCDTLLILDVIEKSSTAGAPYPKGQEGLAKAFGWWIEKGSFMNAVCLTIGNMGGKIPQELVDERRPLFRVNLDPEVLLPKRAVYLQRVNAHLAWLAASRGATASKLVRSRRRDLWKFRNPSRNDRGRAYLCRTLVTAFHKP